MQLTVLGKPYSIRLLEQSDLPALAKFCSQCESMGLENNKDFSSIKLDKMKMPYGQFFVAVDDDKIFSIAGIHHLPEVGPNVWRCLFRGAQLPGYTPQWSMDIFKSGIHFAYFLYAQIKFIQAHNNEAEFYISTNIDNPAAGSSSRLDKVMMPRLAKQGYWHLDKANFMLFNTLQNLWKVNVPQYMASRERWLADENCMD